MTDLGDDRSREGGSHLEVSHPKMASHQDDLLQEFEEFEGDLPFYCESRLLFVKRKYL